MFNPRMQLQCMMSPTSGSHSSQTGFCRSISALVKWVGGGATAGYVLARLARPGPGNRFGRLMMAGAGAYIGSNIATSGAKVRLTLLRNCSTSQMLSDKPEAR